MSLVEIKIEIAPADAEAADNALLELGAAGWSVFEDVVIKHAALVGIFADHAAAQQALAEIAGPLAAAGVRPVGAPAVRELADADWRDSYKAHFKPWQFGRLHWVPIWQRNEYHVPAGDAVLWLDPGLAFGTGNHETTRLCVERLVALATERGTGGRVVDAGCGSGILALSAALLGFADVTGFDNDPEAVRVSQENAALNGLTGRVTFATGDLTMGLARPADIVLANIQADVLIRFARELVTAVTPGGALVLSGILSRENASVREAFEALAPGWAINARTMGEWSDVLLTRPAGG